MVDTVQWSEIVTLRADLQEAKIRLHASHRVL